MEAHGFELGAPLPEAVVAEFEERHEVTLPPAYRLFITELGNDGAGPGVGLCNLSKACPAHCRSPHLARPSTYVPGPRYLDDWEQRYEDPPDPRRIFLPGTLEIAHHGCTLVTRLVVTGPARGRLLNLDCDGSLGPYVVEDPDFLAWYERWLDEALAGYDIGWFGEQLPLQEPELVAALTDDPSPERRSRAGKSLLQLPALGDNAWDVLLDAMTTDADPTVRAELWDLLRWKRHRHPRLLDNAEAIADEVARYARSCTPTGITALNILRRLTFTDVLPELASPDLERRRRAAYQLAWPWGFIERDLPQDLLNEVTSALLGDADALLRSHGVAVVHQFGLTRLRPLLRELHKTETDPWVRHRLGWDPSEQPNPVWDDHLASAAWNATDDPPF
ncbi:hypothetical protein DPM19_23255 [Actinomadura craniellae]|uniref:Knr4/Smi1-like domain-containing protein n=1 Tax=Actinomadura craniellae TaxID=2231787 RepID=A0A365H1H3_9ACTN|nr:hypothetical protein [Actinomadura craniellae]RAY12930.1 hypothetical protein DPM19_23255 [Actinomadura craniellae]